MDAEERGLEAASAHGPASSGGGEPVRFLLRVLILAASMALVSYILPGIKFDGAWSLVLAALVVGLANAILRPLLIFFTLPLVLVSLGLFVFVINAGLLYLASKLVNGFHLESFWWALLASLLISLVSMVLNRMVLGPEKKR
jgi:putative membrane protein